MTVSTRRHGRIAEIEPLPPMNAGDFGTLKCGGDNPAMAAAGTRDHVEIAASLSATSPARQTCPKRPP